MINSAPPPTAAEIRKWDMKIWKGRPHRDICVRMDGTQLVVYRGKPSTVLLYTPDAEHHPNVGQSDDGTVTLVSEQPFHGRACVGIAETP